MTESRKFTVLETVQWELKQFSLIMLWNGYAMGELLATPSL